MSEANTQNASVYSPLPHDYLQCAPMHIQRAQTFITKCIQRDLPPGDLRQIDLTHHFHILLGTKNANAALQHKKRRSRKKKFLTRVQRKELGLLKLPVDNWKYEELEELRMAWRLYMRKNLGLVGKLAPSCQTQDWSSFSTVLAKSELVGAELKVVRSKVPSVIGLSGTVVFETKQTFQIVVKDKQKLKIIIKDSSVFEFQLDSIKFTVFGKHIATRPSDRSVKKIKAFMCPDL